MVDIVPVVDHIVLSAPNRPVQEFVMGDRPEITVNEPSKCMNRGEDISL